MECAALSSNVAHVNDVLGLDSIRPVVAVVAVVAVALVGNVEGVVVWVVLDGDELRRGPVFPRPHGHVAVALENPSWN